MDKHTIELQVKPQNIVESPLEDIMGDRYGVYAKYVIQDRAIPDVRDGLKPVQRRIIFSMYQDHNVFSKPTRKCAHTVGAVMGKFHPHGDSSIYNALARMAQDWKVRLPLIDFQGNKGSIDGDAPAAYRYTEARLSEAAEEMIKDLEKDTVDMQLTFDDTQFEPVVLPSRFPNLLVNGTEGIAVAIATNIPPHNLVEVCEAVIYKIQHKRATLDELLEIIKGPDFPTGGIIYRGEGLRSMYEKGQGRVEVIAKSHIETDKKNINQIVITEIPYDVIKLDIVKEIDVIRVEKVIDGIIEVRDESDRNGLRIVIDVRKDANIDLIKTYLYNKTLLKSSFSANMVAIVDNRPKTFTLMEYLDAYISHQVDVITRRSKFDLEKFKARLHIVDGLIHAISIVDQVVKTIRHSSDKAEAKLNIQREYGFTEIQSEAIVTLQLYKLSNTDISIFVEEKKKLEADIERLNAILEDPAKLDRVIVSDLKDIIKKYGTERLTAIEDKVEFKPIDKRDLISKEEVVFAVTRDGYIKRSSIKSFKSSDSDLPGLKEGDVLVGKGNILTTDFLLLFTNKGNFCYVPVNEIQDNKWKDEGKYISYICALPAEEKIIKAIGIRNFRNDLYIALVTKNGQIKRTNLSEFELNRYSKPVTCMKLLQGDEIADVGVTSGNSNICLVTEEGGAAFYNENQVSKCGLRAAGVKAISNLKLGKIVNMLIYHPDDKNKVFLLTNNGCQRTEAIYYLNLTSRLTKLQYFFKCFKSEPHSLVYAKMIEKGSDSVYLTTMLNDGSIFELKVDDLNVTPIDKYAKSNIDTLPSKKKFKYVFIKDFLLVDDSFQSHANEVLEEIDPVIAPEVEADTNFEQESKLEQSSIFDDMGD